VWRVVNVDGDVGTSWNELRRVVWPEISRRPTRLITFFDQCRTGAPREDRCNDSSALHCRRSALVGAPALTTGRSTLSGPPAFAAATADFVSIFIALNDSWKYRLKVLELGAVLHIGQAYVMGYRELAWQYFDRSHPCILREAARHNKPRPFDDPFRGNLVGRTFDNIIRLDLPAAVGPLNRWRRVFHIAFRGSG